MKLEEGMLLLGGIEERLDTIYTVSKVNKTSCRIIAHHGTCRSDSTLRGNTLPRGWHIIPNAQLARLITTNQYDFVFADTTRQDLWDGEREARQQSGC